MPTVADQPVPTGEKRSLPVEGAEEQPKTKMAPKQRRLINERGKMDNAILALISPVALYSQLPIATPYPCYHIKPRL